MAKRKRPHASYARAPTTHACTHRHPGCGQLEDRVRGPQQRQGIPLCKLLLLCRRQRRGRANLSAHLISACQRVTLFGRGRGCERGILAASSGGKSGLRCWCSALRSRAGCASLEWPDLPCWRALLLRARRCTTRRSALLLGTRLHTLPLLLLLLDSGLKVGDLEALLLQLLLVHGSAGRLQVRGAGLPPLAAAAPGTTAPLLLPLLLLLFLPPLLLLLLAPAAPPPARSSARHRDALQHGRHKGQVARL